jgi:hypothetical protein
MKKLALLALCVALAGVLALSAGCGKKTHPVKVVVDPSFQADAIEKIAVFPFASALSPAADPNNLAPRTFDQFFRAELDTRRDYKWIAPSSVEYALDSEGLTEDSKMFVDGWRKNHKADADFLAKMGKALQADAVLIGVVELWQQDEVDARENAAAASYVGATVTIFSTKDGSVLFEAADEDMLEGVRGEDRDRNIVRSGSGQIYSDPSGALFKAPPLDEVALKVAQALAGSIPAR